MTDWNVFTQISQLLIQYYFGNPLIFYLSIVLLFVILLTAAGVDIRISIIFSLPLMAALAANGILGSYTWVVNLLLVIIAFIYAYALMKIFT